MRFLDLYLGSPLLHLISILRIRKRVDSNLNLKRIALIRTAAIGDTILLSGIIEDIKIKFPKSEITVICGNSNAPIVSYLLHVNKVFVLKTLNPFKLWKPLKALGEFDIAINFGQWPNIDALITWMLKSKFTVGFYTPGQTHHRVYDLKVTHSNAIHEIENFRKLINCIGVTSSTLPKLNISIISPPVFFSNHKEKYVVLIPWCSGRRKKSKEWSMKNWNELIFHLLELNIDKIVICGIQSELQNSFEILKNLEQNDKLLNLVGKTNFNDLVSLIAYSELVISVNTGGLHIASALNKPLIALDGVVPSKRWGPLNKNSISFECSPNHQFIHLGFEDMVDSESFMNEIKVNYVVEAVHKLSNQPLAATNNRMSL